MDNPNKNHRNKPISNCYGETIKCSQILKCVEGQSVGRNKNNSSRVIIYDITSIGQKTGSKLNMISTLQFFCISC